MGNVAHFTPLGLFEMLKIRFFLSLLFAIHQRVLIHTFGYFRERFLYKAYTAFEQDLGISA